LKVIQKYCILISTGRKLLEEQLCELRKTTGKCLRIDHTYKITSALGITINETWVCILMY